MNRIYTVTLNPSLDYTVSVEGFRLGYTNRTKTELLTVGGKGINVSTALQSLGLESTALGFVAGFTGQEAARQLAGRGIGNGLIMLERGLTRINVKLQSVEGTEINGQGPDISKENLAMLEERLSGLAAGDVLFLSGSIPASLPEDTYLRMMGKLAEGVLTVVDVSGQGLVKALPLHPFQTSMSWVKFSAWRLMTERPSFPTQRNCRRWARATCLSRWRGRARCFWRRTAARLSPLRLRESW